MYHYSMHICFSYTVVISAMDDVLKVILLFCLLLRLTLLCALKQCATANLDGRKRALVIGGGIANFTDVAATFSGIIRALREKVSHA